MTIEVRHSGYRYEVAFILPVARVRVKKTNGRTVYYSTLKPGSQAWRRAVDLALAGVQQNAEPVQV